MENNHTKSNHTSAHTDIQKKLVHIRHQKSYDTVGNCTNFALPSMRQWDAYIAVGACRGKLERDKRRAMNGDTGIHEMENGERG